MKINGQPYFFDRCLKFVFFGPHVVDGDKGYLTVEYCPRKDERLCARLECDVQDMPNPQKTDRAGYGGTLRIYNPGEDILKMIANSTVWSNDYVDRVNGQYQVQQLKESQTKKYYANKLQVFVFAGYYKEDVARKRITYDYKTRNLSFVPQMKEEGGLVKGDGDYTDAPVIAAYVNNSYYYRQGSDNILDIYVHDVDMSQQNTKVASFGPGEAIDEKSYGVAVEKTVRGYSTFEQTLLELIKNYGQSDRPYMLSASSAAGKSDWARIHYVWNIEGYQKWVSSGRDNYNKSYVDPKLEAALSSGAAYGGPDYSGWYTNATEFRTMVKELCDYAHVANMNLRWKCERQGTVTDYIIWDADNTPGFSTASDVRTNATVVIWNFQNQLQVPTIKGNGSLSAKMFFNRDIKPMGALAFAMSDAIEGGASSSLTSMGLLTQADGSVIGGIAGKAQNAAIQQITLTGSGSIGGVLNNNKKGKEFGYIFNQAWRVLRVKHVLKTHSNDWYTEVTTLPTAVGGYIPTYKAKDGKDAI